MTEESEYRSGNYQTRFSPAVAEDVEEYREENDITKAETIRQLVRAGLDAKATDWPKKIATAFQKIGMISVLGLVGIMMVFPNASVPKLGIALIVGFGVGVVGVGLDVSVVAARTRLGRKIVGPIKEWLKGSRPSRWFTRKYERVRGSADAGEDTEPSPDADAASASG